MDRSPRAARARRAALELEPAGSVLRAGSRLRGVAVLSLPAAARVEGLTVTAAGRELVAATPKYHPGLYRRPLPRPFGRTRSGSARTAYEVSAELLAGPATLPAGRHYLPFALDLPADAAPSYGGVTVVVEHELQAAARLAGGPRLAAWQPLHVWAGPDADSSPGLAVTLLAAGPPRLELRLESDRLALGRPLRLRYAVGGAAGRRVKHLVLELVGVETSKHQLATDVHHFTAARRVLELAAAGGAGELAWVLPSGLAPSLATPRFSLAWRLEATVTMPWRRGVSASAPLRLSDCGEGGQEQTET
jgi:hypothetical protein